MAFPANWPPRASSGIRSIRFFKNGTATANFSDSAYLFGEGVGANPFTPTPYVAPGSGAITSIPLTPSGTGTDPHDVTPGTGAVSPAPTIWGKTIRIVNDGTGTLEISFDGTNVHGQVKNTDGAVVYRDRYESGISVRGAGLAFRIEAW